jgi:tetratricopeptide (TPR) repeat protein
MIIVVAGFGAYFAYTVYVQQQVDRAANPGLRAVDLWRKQVKTNPNDAPTRVRLAEALASAGMYKEAGDQLKQATKLDPKHPGAYMDLAQLATLNKDYVSAEGYLKKVLDLTAGDFSGQNPRREDAYFHLGEVTLLEKKYSDAAGYLKAAIRVNGTSADSYLKLAQAYEGLGETDGAIEQLKIALLFDPKYAEAHYEIGRLLLQKGDQLNAAINLVYAQQLSPGEPKLAPLIAQLGTPQEWMTKANAAVTAGNLKEAIHDCNMARALDPNDLDAALLEGRLLEQYGDTGGALKAFKDALKLAPSNALAKAGVLRVGKIEGQRLEQTGAYKAALAAYKDALSIAPSDAVALAAVARITPLAKTSKK